jgi:hypothetical protein
MLNRRRELMEGFSESSELRACEEEEIYQTTDEHGWTRMKAEPSFGNHNLLRPFEGEKVPEGRMRG